MKELTCIVCPRGCTLCITGEGENLQVSGNACKRGETFAMAEMLRPMRTICTTVRTVFPAAPVLPVRLSQEIPKDRIFDVMQEIKKITLDHAVDRGDVIIENVLGLAADVISESDLLRHIERRDEDGRCAGSDL